MGFLQIFTHCLYINFGDAIVTVAYFKATLKFMDPLPGRSSALYKCNSLVDHVMRCFPYVYNKKVAGTRNCTEKNNAHQELYRLLN